MKLKMAENSLFALLLRSPWWASLLLALVIVAASMAALPPQYAPFGAVGCLPFVVIAGMAAFRQWRAPSAGQTTRQLELAAAMSWADFSALVEAAYRGQGYQVERRSGGAADFCVQKNGASTLVSAKRWKAARLGIEPLRELDAARRAQDASHAVCLTLGEPSDNARQFAGQQNIRVLQGAELATLLRAAALQV